MFFLRRPRWRTSRKRFGTTSTTAQATYGFTDAMLTFEDESCDDSQKTDRFILFNPWMNF